VGETCLEGAHDYSEGTIFEKTGGPGGHMNPWTERGGGGPPDATPLVLGERHVLVPGETNV